MVDKTVYSGKYLTVKEQMVGRFLYERAFMRPSVQVIPFTKDGKILMIKERRPVEGKIRWKFVSGFMDKPGLNEEQIAQEELMEEAGFVADELVKYYYLEDNHTFVIPINYFLAYGLKENKKPNP